MTKLTVRVIRTYHVKVEAEYGDDEASIVDKATKAVVATKFDAEAAVVLPEGSDE